MKIFSLTILLVTLTACNTLPKSNLQIHETISSSNNNQDLRAAFDIYSSLSKEKKSDSLIFSAHQTTLEKIKKLRIKTNKKALIAIEKNNWKKAIDLYRKHLSIISIDKDFQNSYKKINQKLNDKKNTLRDEFIIIRANYLIDEIPLLQEIKKIDPYDINNNNALKKSNDDAKLIVEKLLHYGLKAIHDKDAATARTLIPIASKLDKNNVAIKKANQALIKMTQPLEQYIQKLSKQGTWHYNNEEYSSALKYWNQILYLDPHSAQIKTNKLRTEKILNSLEELKQR